MLRAPIGNPVQKRIFPLQSLIFFAGAYANCKNAAWNTCSENAKTLQISSNNLMKPVAFYYNALISILREFVRYVIASALQFSRCASVFWQ